MTTKKETILLRVTANVALGRGNHLLKLIPTEARSLPVMYPGQFVQVATPGGHTLLRRPISVCNVDEKANELWLLVARVGRGTVAITDIAAGEELDIILPLGNTFTIEGTKHPLLIGGGVGIAPMLYLAKVLVSRGITPTILLGGRTQEQIVLREEFARYGEVLYTTEDGTLGERGRVTEHSCWQTSSYDRIYTCGPKPMMVAIARLAHERAIDCEVSLENTMACGIGACLCCVEDIHEHGNVCVCTEGPVFNSKALKW